jgi:hypothetical protein
VEPPEKLRDLTAKFGRIFIGEIMDPKEPQFRQTEEPAASEVPANKTEQTPSSEYREALESFFRSVQEYERVLLTTEDLSDEEHARLDELRSEIFASNNVIITEVLHQVESEPTEANLRRLMDRLVVSGMYEPESDHDTQVVKGAVEVFHTKFPQQLREAICIELDEIQNDLDKRSEHRPLSKIDNEQLLHEIDRFNIKRLLTRDEEEILATVNEKREEFAEGIGLEPEQVDPEQMFQEAYFVRSSSPIVPESVQAAIEQMKTDYVEPNFEEL